MEKIREDGIQIYLYFCWEPKTEDMGLFTTHTHTERSVPYEKSVKVTENRAPTDESVRLLNEMTRKAKENIVARIGSEDNLVNFEAVVLRCDPIIHGYEWFAVMKVNGKELKLDGKISGQEYEESFRRVPDAEYGSLVNHKNKIFNTIKHAFLMEVMHQLWEDDSIVGEAVGKLVE